MLFSPASAVALFLAASALAPAPAAPDADDAARRAVMSRQAAAATANPQPRQSFAACTGGSAGGYPCSNVDLLSFVPVADMGGTFVSGVWGWTDPLDGTEYAIVGRDNGTSFVNIADPSNPIHVGDLPTHSGSTIWRDMKVYQHYAFIVSEAGNHGMQVFDLTRLRNVTSPPATFTENFWYDQFLTCHTLAMDEETGFAMCAGSDTCSGGIHFIDVRNPLVPTFAGCFDADGYTHETQCVTYRGPDADHQGSEICLACDGDVIAVVDANDKAQPAILATQSYADFGYIHQGWLTDDQRYMLQNDETDERNGGFTTRTHMWDLLDLDTPVYMGFYTNNNPSIDHNGYIVGNRAYLANYRSGLRIVDLSCIAGGPSALTEIGYFDTYPANDNDRYGGAWSNYPFFASGSVLVTSEEEGLFVVRPLPVPLRPIADAQAPALVCAGGTVLLDGSGSTPCGASGLTYTWRNGLTEVCPPSPSPTCSTMVSTTTTFTLEVACGSPAGCKARAQVTVTATPGAIPSTLGNSLRAARRANFVDLTFASDPDAATYTVFRSDRKDSWPPPYRESLPGPADSEPDVAGPMRLYFYRAAGATCLGVEGP